MKTLIVYKSKTGFTQKYAEIIALETAASCMNSEGISAGDLAGYDRIVYGSRLFAGKIDGLDEFKKVFARSGSKSLVVFATGATPNAAAQIINEMWKANLSEEELSAIPHYYMQAGLNYENMPFIEKTVMKIMSVMMKKKKNKSEQDEGFARAIAASHDISSKEYAMPLIEYLKEENK